MEKKRGNHGKLASDHEDGTQPDTDDTDSVELARGSQERRGTDPFFSRIFSQTPPEHAHTKRVVQNFLKNEGPLLHHKLKDYAANLASYIEEWLTESYLSHSESVVLSLNPFFILECVLSDPFRFYHDRDSMIVFAGMIQRLREEVNSCEQLRSSSRVCPLCTTCEPACSSQTTSAAYLVSHRLFCRRLERHDLNRLLAVDMSQYTKLFATARIPTK